MNIQIDKSKIPHNAILACKILQDNGYEAYLVGGCVRDLIMGESPKDWDITSSATPEESMKIFSPQEGDKYPKCYPTGIDHGTITVALGPVPETDHFEVTVYRSEGEYSDGRRPDQVFFERDLDKDLERRDLTINAIAYDPVNNEIKDPFGGVEDLKRKIIKAVGSAEKRFSEDGLRTMRAARFAARFNFDMDPETKEAIKSNIKTLSMVSKERIQDELIKTLKTKDPSKGLKILQETGCLEVLGQIYLNPNLSSNIEKLNNCSRPSSRISILFYGMPADDVTNNLRFLKFSNKDIRKITFLVKKLNEFKLVNSEEAKIKFIASFKNEGSGIDEMEELMLDFTEAGVALTLPVNNLFEGSSNVISEKDFKKILTGNYLIGIGVPPGPIVKEILNNIYQKILLGEIKLSGNLEEDKIVVEELAKNMWEQKNKQAKIKRRKEMLKMASNFWDLSDEDKQSFLKKKYDFGDGRVYEAGELPHIRDMVNVPAGPEEHHPEKNQAIHNWMVYEQARRLSDNPKDWYAAALHDLGKVYTPKETWPRQFNHESIGVPYVDQLSSELGVPEDWNEIARLVADNHLLGHRAHELTPKRLKKLFEDLRTKENVNSFMRAIDADQRGRLGREDVGHPNLELIRSKYDEFSSPPKAIEEAKAAKLDITVPDLLTTLGLTPGPQLGKIKKMLEEKIKQNPELNKRDTLIELAKSIM